MVQTYFGFKQAEPTQFPYQIKMEKIVEKITKKLKYFKGRWVYDKKKTNIYSLGNEIEQYIPYVKDELVAGILLDLKIRQDLIYERIKNILSYPGQAL